MSRQPSTETSPSNEPRENSTVTPQDYHRLAEAEPDEKVDLLLELIERHPDQRLVLPKQTETRASLNEINLSTESLGAHLSAERAGNASWWDRERNALCLRGADLRGVLLRGAVLRGVDLREADLRGAVLGGCDLRGALMENANLREADLVSARLEEAQLGGANLDQALLENAHLHEAYLRFARLQYAALDEADLSNVDLWGADLEGASLTQANLREALLHEANLQDANLTGSDLRDADLRDAVLREADLSGADLRGAALDGANLERAVLQRALLQSLLLTNCQLKHVHLSEVHLGQTRLRQHQLGGALGEELDKDYEAASYGYLTLEQNFGNLGDPDAARWAYYKKRTMQKLDARQRTYAAFRRRDGRGVIRHGLAYAQAKFVEQVCGYGESIPRTLSSIFLVYVIFTVLYGLTGSVVRAGEAGEVLTLWSLPDLADLATFGLITMTAPEGPQVGLHPNGDLAHLLTSMQTLITVGLTGLLGYVLGNRIHK